MQPATCVRLRDVPNHTKQSHAAMVHEVVGAWEGKLRPVRCSGNLGPVFTHL